MLELKIGKKKKENLTGLAKYRAMPLLELRALYDNFLVPVESINSRWPQAYIVNPDLPLIKQAMKEKGFAPSFGKR